MDHAYITFEVADNPSREPIIKQQQMDEVI